MRMEDSPALLPSEEMVVPLDMVATVCTEITTIMVTTPTGTTEEPLATTMLQALTPCLLKTTWTSRT
jgi:hypothetical protein